MVAAWVSNELEGLSLGDGDGISVQSESLMISLRFPSRNRKPRRVRRPRSAVSFHRESPCFPGSHFDAHNQAGHPAERRSIAPSFWCKIRPLLM